MLGNSHMFTKITINGFTINPVINASMLSNIMEGLTNYSEAHMCDSGTDKKIHNNYLGKMISGPHVAMNESDQDHGLIGACFLENGYLIIKIWDNIFPAQIQADLFITNEVGDLDLILDHLCASAVPHDGLGMFDYTYSKTFFPPASHILEKNNKKDSSYKVNPPVQFFDEYQTDWEVRLNQLSFISCYFCTKKANDWILTQTEEMHHSAFKTIAVCEEHIVLGRRGEVIPNSSDQTMSVDFYTSKDAAKFILNREYDKEKNIEYSINLFKKETNDETNS